MNSQTETLREDALDLAAERAYPLFQLLGWSYFDGEPDTARLRESVGNLLKSAEENPEDFVVISSGRFSVVKTTDEMSTDYRITLNLSGYYDYDNKDNEQKDSEVA